MVYSLPYSFGPGEVARPQEVNANFNAIINQLETINTSKADIDLSNITSDGIDNIKSTSISKSIGEFVISTIPLNDSSLHLLDGSLINPEGIYSDFCTYIRRLYYEDDSANYFTTESDWQNSVTTYGVCAKFVYDTENNTVRLPKISGILEGTTDITESGDLVQAGLPNITGWARFRNMTEKITSGGALSNSYASSGNTGYGDTLRGDSNIQIEFSASNSNSIYGRSNTVQPQTSKVLYYIVVATSAKIDVQVDIDEIATDLNGKADTDLANTTNGGKILMSGMGMPSTTRKQLSAANGGQYTAPANGWLYIEGTSGQSTSFVNIAANMGAVCYGSGGTAISCYAPLKKGQKATIWYNASNIKLYFYYTVGSESEAS